MDRALEGLRVLDLSEGVAGGYCTKLFGCMGAEVIKVEDPAGGDISRRMGPFLDHLPDPETSATYLYLNTNKKSITLNLGTTSGVETLKTLLPSVDVVVETYTPGTMEDKGISATRSWSRSTRESCWLPSRISGRPAHTRTTRATPWWAMPSPGRCTRQARRTESRWSAQDFSLNTRRAFTPSMR